MNDCVMLLRSISNRVRTLTLTKGCVNKEWVMCLLAQLDQVFQPLARTLAWDRTSFSMMMSQLSCPLATSVTSQWQLQGHVFVTRIYSINHISWRAGFQRYCAWINTSKVIYTLIWCFQRMCWKTPSKPKYPFYYQYWWRDLLSGIPRLYEQWTHIQKALFWRHCHCHPPMITEEAGMESLVLHKTAAQYIATSRISPG